MLFRSCFLCASLILLSFQSVADSLPFIYTQTNLGGGEYQYNYSIYNNGSLGAGVPVQLFDVAFDPALYSGLSIVTLNPLASQWNETILSAVGSSPADFDVSAAPPNGGIPVGGTAGTVNGSGFAVDFSWLGQGQPGSQPFQVYDPNSFALLQDSNTISTVSLSLEDGTVSNPAPLPGGPLVSAVTGTIGGPGSEDYYSFLWAGGAFNVTASINGTPSNGSTYVFSYGASGIGGCNSLGSATLNSADSFTTIGGNNANLAPGQYCIGIDANSVNDTPLGLTFAFNTPVEGTAPEPSTFALLFAGTGMLISVLRRRSAAGKFHAKCDASLSSAQARNPANESNTLLP